MNNYTGSVKHSLTPLNDDAELSATKQEIGYTNRIFVQALFPYRKTEETGRTVNNGALSISVMSANGLPYGRYPRLIMAVITTLAVQNAGKVEAGLMSEDEARRIPLGKSMNSFLTLLGLKSRGSGGSNGTVTRVREQLEKLSTSVITIQQRTTNRSRGRNTGIVEDWDLWFDHKNPEQFTLTESYIELTPAFYAHITESPIPIDLDVLRALGKPRAMDAYIWLTVKKYWLFKRNEEKALLPWKDVASALSTQPIENSAQLRDFRKEIKLSINQIAERWPEVDVEVTSEGLVINKGPLPVPPRGARLRLV